MSLVNVSSDISQDIPAFSSRVCPSWFWTELFHNAKNISIIIILGIINNIVIVGNLLVVLAVFATSKLRTNTNFLIVSLAISDLLVGLAVLPFSICLQVLEQWIFGEMWCQIWLAVDVWLCTASILNLCAISIDMYVAISRPLHYKYIMSTMKVKLLIAAVWILSFIICFPPLVGWNDRVQDGEEVTSYKRRPTKSDVNLQHQYLMDNRTFDYSLKIITSNFTDDAYNGSNKSEEVISTIPSTLSSRRCPKPQCALIINQGYVVYSALGSFYIPMLVMLTFYYRIYVVALKNSRALDRGCRTAKSSRSKSSPGSGQGGGGGSDATMHIHPERPTSVSGRSGNASAASSRRSGDILTPRRKPTKVYQPTKEPNSPRCFREDGSKNYDSTKAAPSSSDSSPLNTRVRRTKSANPAITNRELEIEVAPEDHTRTDSPSAGGGNGEQRNGRSDILNKSSKRNALWHTTRFVIEAKATKTVGIIVGCFILCWLPFFTVYLIMGFCEACIPEVLFKVSFYLGYCNSALNPIILGIIRKDFRAAFKNILFRCTLNDDSVASLIHHFYMPTITEEDTQV